MITDAYTITVAPTVDPVTLANTKSWLKIRSAVTADDTLITSLIKTATNQGEKFCNRWFIQRTAYGLFSGLCASNQESYYFLQIRRAPLVSISEVAVYTSGAYVATTDYQLRQTNGFSRVLFPNGITADSSAVYPVKITFIAGHAAAEANVPDDLKTAIYAHVAYLYENRGDVVSDGKLNMPLETKRIYKSGYRILNTF